MITMIANTVPMPMYTSFLLPWLLVPAPPWGGELGLRRFVAKPD